MTAAMAAMAADERRHAETWRRLEERPTGDEGAATAVDAERRGRVAASVAEITKAENWHRGGARDPARDRLRRVATASSATCRSSWAWRAPRPSRRSSSCRGSPGSWPAPSHGRRGVHLGRSQVEVLERQIALERAELAAIPEEEFEELVAIYRSKGLPEADARRFAEHIFQDPELALETLVREELGLDPDELSSPWAAAGGSFVAFCIGAIVPVMPYLFGGGDVVLSSPSARAWSPSSCVGAAGQPADRSQTCSSRACARWASARRRRSSPSWSVASSASTSAG